MSETRVVLPVCYMRLVDAGTDNACWVMCAEGDHGAVGAYLSPNDHPQVSLCHCALSGDVHVIRDGKFCEAHQDKDAEPFTVENVEKALAFLAARPPSPPNETLIKMLRTGLGIDRTTGLPTTDAKLALLSAGASVTPALVWMRAVRDMRATMILAADALEGKEKK